MITEADGVVDDEGGADKDNEADGNGLGPFRTGSEEDALEERISNVRLPEKFMRETSTI